MYNLIKYSDNYSKRSGSFWQILKIIVLLKCLSNFSRTVQMPLTNCEINLIVT